MGPQSEVGVCVWGGGAWNKWLASPTLWWSAGFFVCLFVCLFLFFVVVVFFCWGGAKDKAFSVLNPIIFARSSIPRGHSSWQSTLMTLISTWPGPGNNSIFFKLSFLSWRRCPRTYGTPSAPATDHARSIEVWFWICLRTWLMVAYEFGFTKHGSPMLTWLNPRSSTLTSFVSTSPVLAKFLSR